MNKNTGWALQFNGRSKPSVWSVRATRRECRELADQFKGGCKVVKITIEAV